MSWCARAFFILVGVLAVAGTLGGVGCTRQGKTLIVPVTPTPQSAFYVNPKTGSDTSGNGTTLKPYKTLGKAVKVVTNAVASAVAYTIDLEPGVYSAKSGELFPIVVPTGVSISGTGSYGKGLRANAYIDGAGEDLALEKTLGYSQKYYAALEVASGASVALNDLYIGAKQLSAPDGAYYDALDALGTVTPSYVTFGSGIGSSHLRAGGIAVPSGTLSCTACTILGNLYALITFTIPNGGAPSVTLGGQFGASTVGGRYFGLLTDGTANLTISNQTFVSKVYAYSDSLHTIATPAPSSSPSSIPSASASSSSPYPSSSPTSGPPTQNVVDFGYGPSSSSHVTSTGGNSLTGAQRTELDVSAPGTIVWALANAWQPDVQHSNPSNGHYTRNRIFPPGTLGGNVTVSSTAAGSEVYVGPPPAPTPTPSATPSTSPSPSPT